MSLLRLESVPFRRWHGVNYIDIETFSSVDLKAAGVYAYRESPDFEILMAAWSNDGEYVHLAVGEAEIRAIPGLWDPTILKVAHNAQFDRVCLSVLKPSPPEEWLDTMALAAEAGYPQRLKDLAKALGAEDKDTAGTRLINQFCKPQRGKRVMPEDKPEQWEQFQAYCKQDVYTLMDVHRRLPDWPTDMERLVYQTDQVINDRGIKVDLQLATAAMATAEENQSRNLAELKYLTELDNPNSNTQLLQWLKDSGLDIFNLQAATVKTALAGELTDEQRRVLELRQELALVASKKFKAALLGASSDGRLRGSFRFFAAHTGRWAGRGTQLHNLPRATVDNVDLAIMEVMNGFGATDETLKALVRPLFIVDGTVMDYSAIEARVLAWLAGEQWVLDAFEAGRDIYVETAQRMGGLTRFQGKVACIAEGSKVLTDQGMMEIEKVTTDHLVWDGCEWVSHQGLIYRGQKEVMTYDGLTATPGHLVWTEGSSRPVRLDRAAADRSPLLRSESSGAAIRLGEDYQSRTSLYQRLVRSLRPDSMHRLRFKAMAISRGFEIRQIQRMPALFSTKESGRTHSTKTSRSLAKVHRSQQWSLQRLRSSWDRIQIHFCRRSSLMGVQTFGSPWSWNDNRSNRQRRSLRGWEPALGESISTDAQSAQNSTERVSPEPLALHGSHRSQEVVGGPHTRSDHRTGSSGGSREAQGVAENRRTVAVYDLLNAGPRHRFTVSGVLVHNCLALGYAGGIRSLKVMMGEAVYIDPSGKMVTGGSLGAARDSITDLRPVTNDELQQMVNQWRRANPAIVKLWTQMENAVADGGTAGRITIRRDGEDMYLQLPSGRSIVYHGVRWENYAVPDPATGRWVQKRGWRYDDPKSSARIGQYGGRLCENVTQAVARDVLAEAMVRLEERGFPVVGHVHDEIIVESDKMEEIAAIMCERPAWAEGLPLDAEGFVCERYRKG